MNASFSVRVICLYLLFISANTSAEEQAGLQGTWQITAYLNAKDQVRYSSEGYMMFGKEHWLHLIFFNRDERAQDFSEAHHGTYRVTGPNTLDLNVDMDLHMDPRIEFQETPVWYGPVDNIKAAGYRVDGKNVVIDLPSGSQIVLQRLE